jgi:hypothetical protein
LWLTVGRELFPFNRRKRVPLQGLAQFLMNAFAIRAVGHDHNSHLLFIKVHRVIPLAIVMAFFEEGFPE